MSSPAPESPYVPRGLAVTAAWTWRVLLLAFAAALLAVALWELKTITVPIFVAVLLTTLLLPPTRMLERRGMRPALATGLVFLVTALILVTVVYFLSAPVADQFGQLGPQVSDAIDQVNNWLTTGPLNLSEAQIDQYIDRASNSLRDNAGALQSGLLTSATVVGEVLIGVVVVIVLTFFFVKDGEFMTNSAIKVFPAQHQDKLHRAAHRAFSVLSGYLRGIAMTGIVDAALIGIALVIIGVPLVLPLMLLTFIAAFLPVVGATTAGAVAALVALVNGGFTDALWVILAVIIVQQVEGHLLQPLLVGRAVALHPAVIITALVTGSVIVGLLGALLAVPLTAMVVGVVREMTDRYPAQVTTAPDGATD